MTKVVVPIHGRDHCPGGPDPIPCLGADGAFFRAYLMRYPGSPQAAAISGIGTTNVQLRYDWWENSDPDVFEPRAYTGGSNPPVMSTDLLGSVRLYQPGHYTICVGALFDDQYYGHKLEWNDSDAPFGFAESGVGGGDSETRPSSGVYNIVGIAVQTLTRIYPLPDYDGDPPNVYWPADLGDGSAFVEGYVTAGSHNISGASDNSIGLAFLEILFKPFTIPPA